MPPQACKDSRSTVPQSTGRRRGAAGRRLGDGADPRGGKVIQVIEGIAFQTKILALNAAVESACAGAPAG